MHKKDLKYEFIMELAQLRFTYITVVKMLTLGHHQEWALSTILSRASVVLAEILKTYSPKRIVSTVIPILWPFLVIFFAYHISIFHKIRVQTIIWTWTTCLNLDCTKKQQIKQNFPFPLFYKIFKTKSCKLMSPKWVF